ncbi:hypothetical protein GA0070216_12092 [Micromonospora matsumotoense]|uniref:Uncharacterized protein n=1 Tax=Micromonospora matsumotoense TaxID=121616 RepID=A0A1C5ANS7_9ACTN|nr:hypothetical protein GA0070216_12092 [Micromonospora matsumotoense]
MAAGSDAPVVAGPEPKVEFGDYYPAMKPYFEELRGRAG